MEAKVACTPLKRSGPASRTQVRLNDLAMITDDVVNAAFPILPGVPNDDAGDPTDFTPEERAMVEGQDRGPGPSSMS